MSEVSLYQEGEEEEQAAEEEAQASPEVPCPPNP